MKVKNSLKLLMLTLSLALLMSTAGLAASPDDVGTQRIPFTAYNIACSLKEGEVWVSDGGIYHIRGRVLQSVVISEESDYHNGTGEIVGNANIFDPSLGLGTYFGSLEIYPTDMKGYWVGNWSVQITENGPKGVARLKGYGPDLEGMLSQSSLIYLPPNILANFAYLCGGDQPVAGTMALGEILIPGGE
jgi:hypothetical protein